MTSRLSLSLCVPLAVFVWTVGVNLKGLEQQLVVIGTVKQEWRVTDGAGLCLEVVSPSRPSASL